MDNPRVFQTPENVRHESHHIGVVPEFRDSKTVFFKVGDVFFHEHLFFRGQVYCNRGDQFLDPVLFHLQDLFVEDTLVGGVLVDDHKVLPLFGKDIDL